MYKSALESWLSPDKNFKCNIIYINYILCTCVLCISYFVIGHQIRVEIQLQYGLHVETYRNISLHKQLQRIVLKMSMWVLTDIEFVLVQLNSSLVMLDLDTHQNLISQLCLLLNI